MNLEEKIVKLEEALIKKEKIIDALKKRVTRSINQTGNSFTIFENNLLLQNEVEERTRELKKSLEEIKRKDEMLVAQSRTAAMGEMVSMIAHQWRQPLAVINVETHHLLLDMELGSLDRQEVKDHVNNITKQTSYLSQTIEDFGNFFKANTSKVITTPEEIVEKTYTIVGSSLVNSKIELQTKFDINEPFLVSKNELLQVMVNLLNNAKDALLDNDIEHKKIVIESEKNSAGNLKLIVRDNGGGIPKENLTEIFNPYFSTKGLSGTGLGLYICKTIIERNLKGKISVSNNDEGAVFTILLPLEEAS